MPAEQTAHVLQTQTAALKKKKTAVNLYLLKSITFMLLINEFTGNSGERILRLLTGYQ